MESRLILGSCLDVLPTLPSASVDCVICDPPYPCIDRSYGRWTEAEWFDMMRVVVPECMRILKPTGSAVFILQPNSERVGRMRTWLWEFMVWVGKEWGIVQDVWWWNYVCLPSGGATEMGLLRGSVKACIWIGSESCYRNQEEVLWTKGKQHFSEEAAKRWGTKTLPSGHRVNYAKHVQAAERRGGVTPYNLLPVANGHGSEHNASHGASTPIELCSWWLRYICQPRGTVLDPFSGSGTVALAAWKLDREYIGIEVVPEYHEIAERRLAKARAGLGLFEGIA